MTDQRWAEQLVGCLHRSHPPNVQPTPSVGAVATAQTSSSVGGGDAVIDELW